MTRRTKIIITLPLLLIITLAGVAALDFSDKTSLLFDKETPETTETSASTTSTQPSAQPDFDAGDNTNKTEAGNTTGDKNSTAVITDTNGSTSQTHNNPTISSTGEISVYDPAANTVISTGKGISGSSTLPNVSYRIIDNVSGMIASGQLKVVGGKFSGTIAFSTSATEGRLDIYAVRSDGSEYSNIEIPVRFE